MMSARGLRRQGSAAYRTAWAMCTQYQAEGTATSSATTAEKLQRPLRENSYLPQPADGSIRKYKEEVKNTERFSQLFRRPICTSAVGEEGIWEYGDSGQKTWDLISFFEVHPPLKKVLLPGETAEITVVPDEIIELFGSGAVLLADLKRKGHAFAFPLDPTMLRVNIYGHFVVAPGTKMRKTSEISHYYLDVVYYGELLDSCLKNAAKGDPSKIPEIWRNLIKRMVKPGAALDYPFLVDPTFLTSKAWPYAYLGVYLYITGSIDAKALADIENLMPSSAYLIWNKDLTGNPILDEFFTFRGPAQPGRPRMLANRDINSPKDQRDYYRHTLSHATDYVLLVMKYLTKDLHVLLKEKGGDKLLCSMVEAVTKKLYDMLVELNLERHLCGRYCACCPFPEDCVRTELSKHTCPQANQIAINEAFAALNYQHLDLAEFAQNQALEHWKNLYRARSSIVKADLVEGFWREYDAVEFSIWLCEKNDEAHMAEAKNKIWGLSHQIELHGKIHAFGNMMILGSKTPLIKGVWLFRGPALPVFVQKIHCVGNFNWRKADVSDPAEKDLVSRLIVEDGSGDGVTHVRCVC